MDENPVPVTPKTPRSVPLGAFVAMLVGVALVAGGIAYWAASNAGEKPVNDAAEPTATASVTPTQPATPAVDAPAETPPPPAPKPSYKRYAHIVAIEGPAGSEAASLDFFEILLDDEAIAYANAHGIEPPGNGILYVNEDAVVEAEVPLADGVAIQYASGGVEALELHAATVQQLKSFLEGDYDAMPGAMTDRWTVTVEEGEVVRIQMLVIAD